MASLVEELERKGRGARLYIPVSKKDEILVKLKTLSPGFDPQWLISRDPLPVPCFIVLDNFKSSKAQLKKWSLMGPVIGIDEGGHWRGSFDFLVDLLPGLSRKPAPNILAVNLLPLPGARRQSFHIAEKRPLKVLISFGAEDEAGLGEACVRELEGKKFADKPDIKVVSKKIPGLREHLAEYDVVVSHYGLTAFEAIYARVPVVLLSPGAYHEKLALAAGFVSLGIGKKAARRLSSLLALPLLEKVRESCEAIAFRYGLEENQSQSFSDYVSALEPLPGPAFFPRSGPGRVIARFTDRTYRRLCGGIIGMSRLGPPPIEYSKDYFFADYKKQYGKTYLEDFPSLRETGKRRLGIIKKLLSRSHKSRAAFPKAEGLGKPLPGKTFAAPGLLDIGCAYGAFLAAAREEGFAPFGCEPAEDAARYVREKLGIPCVSGFFPQAQEFSHPGTSARAVYDVVSLWYVIEHFTGPGGALDEVYRLLSKDGVLAFSTPSYSGISGKKSLGIFLKNSPADHWTVWNPSSARRILGLHGFRLKKIVVSGHHPERFPLVGSYLRGKKGNLYHIFLAISRLFRLGDTFEAYAVKVKRPAAPPASIRLNISGNVRA
jgi:SAM-dependent methyltransferase